MEYWILGFSLGIIIPLIVQKIQYMSAKKNIRDWYPSEININGIICVDVSKLSLPQTKVYLDSLKIND